jgi:hypothetical protein
MIRTDLRDQVRALCQLRLQAIVKRPGAVNIGRRITRLIRAPEPEFDQPVFDLSPLFFSHTSGSPLHPSSFVTFSAGEHYEYSQVFEKPGETASQVCSGDVL